MAELGPALSRALVPTVRRMTGVGVEQLEPGAAWSPAPWTSIVAQYQQLSEADLETMGMVRDSDTR